MEGDGHLCILNTVYIEYCFFDVVLYCVISFFLLHYSAAKKFQIDSIKSKEWKREGNTRTQSLPLAWLLSSHNPTPPRTSRTLVIANINPSRELSRGKKFKSNHTTAFSTRPCISQVKPASHSLINTNIHHITLYPNRNNMKSFLVLSATLALATSVQGWVSVSPNTQKEIMRMPTSTSLSAGALHGESASFLPLEQCDNEYYAPRVVQVSSFLLHKKSIIHLYPYLYPYPYLYLTTLETLVDCWHVPRSHKGRNHGSIIHTICRTRTMVLRFFGPRRTPDGNRRRPRNPHHHRLRGPCGNHSGTLFIGSSIAGSVDGTCGFTRVDG